MGSTCFEKRCALGRRKEDLRGLKLPRAASEIFRRTMLSETLAPGIGGEGYRPLEGFQ